MDQSTHEVRLASWRQIVERFQERPHGQSTKEWLRENNIPEKRYYYWMRKIRKLTFEASKSDMPSITAPKLPATFAEIPAHEIFDQTGTPAITIRTQNATVEISSAISEALMIKLVKAVSHAL